MSRILNKRIFRTHIDAAKEYIKQSKYYSTYHKAAGNSIRNNHMAKGFAKLAEEQVLMAELYIAEDEEV